MKSTNTVFSGLTRFRLASLIFSSLVLVSAAAEIASSQGLPSRPSSPFDMAKWKARVSEGAQYYECNPPNCSPSTLVSYLVQPLQSDARKTFDVEVDRWIGTPGDRNLLAEKKIFVFSTTLTPELLTLNASWEALAVEQKQRPFGAMRIGIKNGLRFQVLATSAELAAAKQNEFLMSRALGLIP